MLHPGPKLLTQIAAVHFVSHVHIMLIPALLRNGYGFWVSLLAGRIRVGAPAAPRTGARG